MTRTQIYLPDDVHELVKKTAGEKQISMASFIRECIGFRCRQLQQQKKPKAVNKAALALLRIARIAEKAKKFKGGPSDLASNHDYYLAEESAS